jgi:NADH-quinone oxidoreductase subunit J
MQWIQNHPALVVGLALFSFALLWLMPTHQTRSRAVGLLLLGIGSLVLGYTAGLFSGPWSEQAMVAFLGGVALISGALMITCRNPVYGSLSFAILTLCTCGLFVLQEAPFLAAATVIVYAGAILVTFMFVLMLAQQGGTTHYDRTARRPLAAVLLGAVFLGIVLGALQPSSDSTLAASLSNNDVRVHNSLTRVPADAPLGTMHGLGRSLFGDYLLAVELAGTLLLVASIGAIVIAPRRGVTKL